MLCRALSVASHRLPCAPCKTLSYVIWAAFRYESDLDSMMDMTEEEEVDAMVEGLSTVKISGGEDSSSALESPRHTSDVLFRIAELVRIGKLESAHYSAVRKSRQSARDHLQKLNERVRVPPSPGVFNNLLIFEAWDPDRTEQNRMVESMLADVSESMKGLRASDEGSNETVGMLSDHIPSAFR